MQFAPWNPEQVSSLNAYQNDPNCLAFLDAKSGQRLFATARGWVLPGTDEVVDRQAYPWMLDGTWRIPLRPTGNTGEVTLRGAIFVQNQVAGGWQPYLVCFPQSRLRYLPCFTTEAKLWFFMNEASAPVGKISEVCDPPEFLESLREADVEAILNPYFTEEGKIRFLQVSSD